MKALKKILVGSALAFALTAPLVTPQPADAWGWRGGYGWHGGWGWHAGWGWRGGVYVGGPAIVVGAPGYYAPGYYGYRWIPPHYTPYGAFIPGHWGY